MVLDQAGNGKIDYSVLISSQFFPFLNSLQRCAHCDRHDGPLGEVCDQIVHGDVLAVAVLQITLLFGRG